MISSLLKARRAGHHVLLGVLWAAFPCAQGVAATNWFDPVPSTAPLEGGAGNWADANWKAASNAVSGALWVDGNDAWFQPIAPQTNNLGGNAYTAGTLTANSALGLIALTNGSLAVSRIDSPGNNPLILDLATTSIGAGGVSNINTGSAKVLFLGSNVQLTADQTWVQTSSGGATFSNGTINLGGHTLTLAAYNSAALKGTITGSGSLVVGGTSAFTFSGTNASSAPTRILSSLALGNSTLYAAGTITNLGQLILSGSGSGASFVGSEIVGTGQVVLSSSGTHYLTNANSYSGGTFLTQNSTLWASNASALGSGALVLSNNGTVNFAEFEHTLGEVTVINGTLMNGVLHTPRLMIGAGTVSAGIGGTGAVVKTISGTVVLSGSNSYSGPTIVALGILSNTASASALPFGSGSLILSNTAMARISPTGSGGALGFLGGTNPGSTLTYDGGATLGLRTGSYTQVSYTFGDGNPSSEVLLRSGRGTLVIYDSAGSGANSLGVDEKFLINGLAPTNINGMVAPTIARIGQGALSASPLFLVYDPANGFQTANFEKTDFSGSAGTNKVALANSSTHGVAEGQTASAYAIRFGGTGSATVILSNNATLAVGDNASGGFGGISIGNGSSILAASGATNVALAFGASEGVFVLGSGSGVVGVPITGTGGLTKYGYQSGIHSGGAGGNLALVSATSTISGPLSINQGALILSNGAAYLGATTVRALGAIQVFTGSLLQATSDFSLGAAGGLTVYTGGTVNIGGDLLHEGLSGGALALRGGALNVAGQLLQKGGSQLSLVAGRLDHRGLADQHRRVRRSPTRLGNAHREQRLPDRLRRRSQHWKNAVPNPHAQRAGRREQHLYDHDRRHPDQRPGQFGKQHDGGVEFPRRHQLLVSGEQLSSDCAKRGGHRAFDGRRAEHPGGRLQPLDARFGGQRARRPDCFQWRRPVASDWIVQSRRGDRRGGRTRGACGEQRHALESAGGSLVQPRKHQRAPHGDQRRTRHDARRPHQRAVERIPRRD
ncbi:MAG: hypothetical protein HUU04_04060 [Verrucomicrobiae bacterium]|nr:hypothetical protein [Verrucomicrobiae bacterium]